MTNQLGGTGDGGVTPGRKLKAFIWMVLGVLSCVFMTTKIHTPETLAINALWAISIGGLVCVGGQSLVDTFEKIAMGKQAVAEAGATSKTTESRIDITTEKK